MEGKGRGRGRGIVSAGMGRGGGQGAHQSSGAAGDSGRSDRGGGNGGTPASYGAGSNSGGSYGGRNNSSGGYGGGSGGGGGYRKNGLPPTYVDPRSNPDPFIGKYSQDQVASYQQTGWTGPKELNELSHHDMILQQYKGAPAKWKDTTIRVSVNHFPVESTKTGQMFPLFFHYDVNIEVLRKAGKVEAKSEQSSPLRKKFKVEEDEEEFREMTFQLENTNIDAGTPRPLQKKLPRQLTQVILNYILPYIQRDVGVDGGIATDGSKNMYSTRRIHQVPLQYELTFDQLREWRRKLGEELEEAQNGTIRVTIQPAIDDNTGRIRTISTADFAGYFEKHGTLQGYQFTPELRQSLEAACNTFLRSLPTYQYFSVGRSSMVPCTPKYKAELGNGLVAWRGVTANITMGWKPYLNVDIANCAFILGLSIPEVLKRVIPRRNDPNNDHVHNLSKWDPKEYNQARSFLKSCKITYKVDGKTFGGTVRDLGESVSDSFFEWNGRKISVFNYYRERYGKTLNDPDGPVVIKGVDAMIPAEICIIKKGQSYNRKLDGKQTSEMLKFAKKNPLDHKKAIMEEVAKLNLKGSPVTKALDVKISDRMLSLEARVLVPPALRYGEGKGGKVAIVQPVEGVWDMWSKDHEFDFYKTVPIAKWGVLVFGCGRNVAGPNDKPIWDFIASLKRHGSNKGVQFPQSNPHVEVAANSYRKDPEDAAKENRDRLVKIFSEKFSGCTLIVVILPEKGSPLYGHVKHAAEVDVGVLTQCVMLPNIVDFRRNTVCKDATIQNILLKINAKLGGTNYVVVAPFNEQKGKQFCQLIQNCPVLVLGADVTHAPPGSAKLVNGREFDMPSYAAVTGSLDKSCMPFMTEVRAQRKANRGAAEVIQDMKLIVNNMLRAFKKTSGIPPKKIIYFRDGVGEGQFQEVLHVEMSAIREACMEIKKGYEPKITFITVQKRHKTRIFPDQGSSNCPAGTVIDTEIVHPTEMDFYLLSHKGMMGTSRPSRYHVLWDDSDFSADELQSLTYTLCYMFVRCTKSVKMPAPTYYAHLAAERAKKLCEGFEGKYGKPSDENLNKMLQRETAFTRDYPMHFV